MPDEGNLLQFSASSLCIGALFLLVFNMYFPFSSAWAAPGSFQMLLPALAIYLAKSVLVRSDTRIGDLVSLCGTQDPSAHL